MPRRKKATPYCQECPHCLGQPIAPHNPPCPECRHCREPGVSPTPASDAVPAPARAPLREIDLDAPVERPVYTISGQRYELKEPADLSPMDWVEINRLIRETTGAFDGVDTDDDEQMLAAVGRLDRLNRRMMLAITYTALPPDVLDSMTTRQMKGVSDFFSRITLEGRTAGASR